MEKTQALSLRQDQLVYLNQFTVKGLALKAEAEALEVKQPSDLILANQTFKRAQALRKDIVSNYKDLVFPFQDFVKQVKVLADECGQPGEQAELIISQKILAYNEKVENERRIEAEKEKARLENERINEEHAKFLRDEEEARLRKIEEDRLEAIRVEQERERARIALEQDAFKRAQRELEAKRLEEEAKLEAERVRLAQQAREQEQKQKDIDAQKAKMDADEKAKENQEKQDVLDKANHVKGLRTGWTFEIVDEPAVQRQFCSPDSKLINAAIKGGLREMAGLRIYEEKRIQ